MKFLLLMMVSSNIVFAYDRSPIGNQPKNEEIQREGIRSPNSVEKQKTEEKKERPTKKESHKKPT